MDSRGKHSSPPESRDRGGIPIVQPSPSRSNAKLTESLLEEEDNDEIQLCKVPVKTNTNSIQQQQPQQQQRNKVEHFNRNYQPPSIASSPQLDSWQDASTEPITPYKGDTPVNHMVYSPPPPRQLKKPSFPISNSLNPIEAPPNRLYLPANMKRKAEESESSTLPTKKLSRLSAQQHQKIDVETINRTKLTSVVNEPPSLPKIKVDAIVTTETMTPVPEPKIHVLRDEEPIKKNNITKEEDKEVKDNKPEEEHKKLTKEEEAARVAEEISHLMKNVKNLANYYKLVDKIGEGTFSTVYKAVDVRRDYYDNKNWAPYLLNAPTRLSSDEDVKSNDKSLNDYVALKRIYHTSSPRRIATEIAILKLLRGSPCISPLITAFRQQDQVFVVMPYIPHDDFKKTFTDMSLMDIKYYLRSLFTALSHLHHHKILHRDVKPNNFLYSRRRKTGYLIDFGLAEHQDDSLKWEAHIAELEAKSQNDIFLQSSRAVATSTINSSSVLAALTNKENRTSRSAAVSSTGVSSTDATTPIPTNSSPSNISRDTSETVRSERRTMGYVRNDARHQVRANRAGTRGFRAPEILMRVTRQTAAIDVWSAGVILLSFMTSRYPFFIANDESDAVVELAQLFGVRELTQCAARYNRNFATNLNLPKERISLIKMCQCLHKDGLSRWEEQDIADGLDLLEKSLDLNCSSRISASDALKHPFLKITQDKIDSEKLKEEKFKIEDAKRAEGKAKVKENSGEKPVDEKVKNV